jgi:hypothetical protein
MKDYVAIIIATLSAVVSVVSVLTARRQFALARKVFSQSHEHNRRQIAFQILGQWDEKTLESRKAIMSRWADTFNRNMTIPWAEIEAFRKRQLECLADSTGLEAHGLIITDHMAKIFNYFELIAVSVYQKIADEQILRESASKPFSRWYILLYEFRVNVERQRGYKPWARLDWLYHQWNDEDTTERERLGDVERHNKSSDQTRR